MAAQRGISTYVGDGGNRWPAVHRLDAARLYRLAVEGAPGGARLHGVAEEGVAFRDIAEAIGRMLSLPVVSLDPADAAAHFGWIAGFAQVDGATSSTLTRELLAWEPTGPTLLEDLDAGAYRAITGG